MSPDILQSFNQTKGAINDEIDKYVNELSGQTNGDYGLAAKQIEAQYKDALGSDDTARQQFLKQVASTLEDKVGRINYDYNTGTYRLNQDTATQTQRLDLSTQRALDRLQQDEQSQQQALNTQNRQQTQQTQGDLNARGLVNGPYGQITGLGGQVQGDTQQAIQLRNQALQRATARSTEDINTQQTQGLQDINLNQSRGLQDLATGARRGAIDAQQSHDFNLEAAQRQRDQQLAAIKRSGYQSKLDAFGPTDYITRSAYGAY